MTHADQSPAQPQGAQEQMKEQELMARMDTIGNSDTSRTAPTNEATRTCVWHIDDAGGDSPWETTCKHAFEFNDGGPIENGFKFCGYCGGTLIESRSSEDDV